MSSVPKAFISYSWETQEHISWVRQLASRLRGHGIDVTLDQWHAVPGDQLSAFMETAIRQNDYVLIICTSSYKDKSDKRVGGVGYEGDVMTSEQFTTQNQRKFIPILHSGTWATSSPSWLLGKYYIDLRGVQYPEDSYQRLLKTLHGKLETAPPLGEAPISVPAPQVAMNPLGEILHNLKAVRVFIQREIPRQLQNGLVEPSSWQPIFTLHDSIQNSFPYITLDLFESLDAIMKDTNNELNGFLDYLQKTAQRQVNGELDGRESAALVQKALDGVINAYTSRIKQVQSSIEEAQKG